MNSDHELLLENYNLIYRLKEQAENLRKESDMLLSGMRQILVSKGSNEIYEKMFSMFQSIIPYKTCFLIDHLKPGSMICNTSTNDTFIGSLWEVDQVIKKALVDNPIAIFNIINQPAWTKNKGLIGSTKSVLYCPLKVSKHTSVIVFCSEEIGYYTKSHVQIAERYREFTEQTILSVEAKLTALESEKLKKEKADAERTMLESEKMASLGLLAAGVAHEINNPIAFVKSNIDFLTESEPGIQRLIEVCTQLISKDDLQKQDIHALQTVMDEYDLTDFPADLKDICLSATDGINRVTGIIASLRSFTRNDEFIKFDVNEYIENSIRLVTPEFSPNKSIQKKLSDDLPPLLGSAGKFNQIIVNLLVNASQALDANGVAIISSEPADDHIKIAVEDNGCGISESALNQIFEPFYTTKQVGQGTGLGLYITFQNIEAMGGKITVQSEPNIGTRFEILIPITNL